MEETTTSTGTLTLSGDASYQKQRSIPFGLATEILSKLSVKFLLKFSTTCKSWNSLIHDPKFIKKHLRLSTKRHRLITTTCIPTKKFTVMSYQLHSLPFNSIFNVNATQYEYSPVKLDYHDRLVASCDGIICFAINQNLAVLWNPSIGKLKTLPTLETPKDGDDDGHTVYGFGYDPFVDNYKVVSVFYYNVIHACKTEVSVYTLGTDCWRRIEDFPPLIPYSQQGVFVCGTVNWLAYYDLVDDNDHHRAYAIVSLDLENETYHEISQPDYGGVIDKLTLTLMKDCLCVFSHSDSFDDVWVMKEFGNDESWVKLIRIPRFSNGCLYFENTKILYAFEDDNHVLLLMQEKFKLKWVVYDFKNDTVKFTKFQDFGWVESEVYVESLLSP